MSKYWEVFKISWENSLIYRLNFVLWRIRSTLQLLLIYFIWWTVFQGVDVVFGYTQKTILTYIMVAALMRAVILSSRVTDLANQINDGSVVNFLVKPLSFIKFYLVRDLADKLLNIVFVIFEISLLIFLLKPQIIIQTNMSILLLTIAAALFGIIVYFCISFIVSLLAFWAESSWAFLFLMTILLEGFGGGLFPIDILPRSFYYVLMLTPFPYLIYFPSKLYLGTMNLHETSLGFTVLSFWLIVLWFLMRWIFQMGLKHYTAQGN